MVRAQTAAAGHPNVPVRRRPVMHAQRDDVKTSESQEDIAQALRAKSATLEQ